MNDLDTPVWAVGALGALAHQTRLAVFRKLVKAGPDGVIAGSIAEQCGVPPSTISRAGLVRSMRESRLIHYSVDYANMQRLLTFLMEDCCQGKPEMCGNLLAELTC